MSTSEERLAALFETLAESVEAMTDEEIIEECIENGEDPHEVAERMRAVLRDALAKHEAEALDEARDTITRLESELKQLRFEFKGLIRLQDENARLRLQLRLRHEQLEEKA